MGRSSFFLPATRTLVSGMLHLFGVSCGYGPHAVTGAYPPVCQGKDDCHADRIRSRTAHRVLLDGDRAAQRDPDLRRRPRHTRRRHHAFGRQPGTADGCGQPGKSRRLFPPGDRHTWPADRTCGDLGYPALGATHRRQDRGADRRPHGVDRRVAVCDPGTPRRPPAGAAAGHRPGREQQRRPPDHPPSLRRRHPVPAQAGDRAGPGRRAPAACRRLQHPPLPHERRPFRPARTGTDAALHLCRPARATRRIALRPPARARPVQLHHAHAGRGRT